MFTLLKAPDITQATPAHRFMVEVASNELDYEGIPLDIRTVDLLLSVPTREAISVAIAEAQWLKGYSLMSYWLPEVGGCEF